MKFGTRLLHPGDETDPHTGASGVPIYQASTFHHTSLSDPPPYDYSRSGNPTRAALEHAISELEGGAGGFACSTGMAAITTVISLFSAGDHVICSRDVYGGTYRLLSEVFSRLGIETSFVEMGDLDAVRQAIRPETRVLYVETPSNPLMKVTDLRGIVAAAKSHNLTTLIDNTFMTPYLQRPLDLGFDIVVHSATKFLAGHSDVLAGLVVAREPEWAERIRFLQNALGTVLGPHDAWLVMRGMKTLKARMDAAQAGADEIAAWLRGESGVEAVHYPGDPRHPGAEIHAGQAGGGGAVLSFDLGSGRRAEWVLEHVRIPLAAVSLGAVESILSYPARMSHAAMPPEVRADLGITDGLLRLSVGLEDPGDLKTDLAQAIAGAPAP